MKTELPTKPGAHYWRESDRDKWEPVKVDKDMDVHFLGWDMYYGAEEIGGNIHVRK